MSSSVLTQNEEMDITDTPSVFQQDSNTQVDDSIQITDTLDLPTKQVYRAGTNYDLTFYIIVMHVLILY